MKDLNIMNIDMQLENSATVPYIKSQRVRLALILGSLAALGPLSVDMYLPALPGLAKDLNTSASLVQLSLTFFLLGLALGQLFAGPFSDTRGRRLPLLVGLILYSISSILCALIPSVWALIAFRFLQGVAGAAGIVTARAIVRDLYEGPEMTRFFSRLMLVNGVAPVLAPIAGGQLLRVTSWQGVFVILTGVGVALFFAVYFGIPETLPSESRSKGGVKATLSVLKDLTMDRVFMGYALAQGFVIAALFAYISGSPFVLQNIYEVSPQMFSYLFAINSCGIIMASQLTGRLAGKVSENTLFRAGLAMTLVGGLTLLIAVTANLGLYLMLPSLFLVVSSVGVVGSSGFTLAMQNQGKAAGSASGILGVLGFILGALAAPLVGIAGNRSAVPLGIVVATVSLGAVLSYRLLVMKKMNN